MRSECKWLVHKHRKDAFSQRQVLELFQSRSSSHIWPVGYPEKSPPPRNGRLGDRRSAGPAPSLPAAHLEEFVQLLGRVGVRLPLDPPVLILLLT